MRGALKIGRFLGINIFVHWSFLLIFFLVAYITWEREGVLEITSLLRESGFTMILFFIVVMHEYGHALMARKYGIGTKKIMLFPLGGVAQLEGVPEKPKQELWIALAGPAVNFALLVIFTPIAWWLYSDLPFHNSDFLYYFLNHNIIARVLVMNLVLLVFNMIPAFPMDGGRVLRALLSMWLNPHKATLIAVRIGQLIAVGFIALSYFMEGAFMLSIIGLFVIIAAQAELNMLVRRNRRFNHKVGDVLFSSYTLLHPRQTLREAYMQILSEGGMVFLVMKNDQVVGLLTRNDLVKAIDDRGNSLYVEEVMEKDIPSVEAAQPLQEAIALMQSRNLPLLPVVNNGMLVGAINADNIMQFLRIRQQEG